MFQALVKTDKAYISVPRPALIKTYNESMGGVDLCDRLLGYFNLRARTKKWTVRFIFHLVSLL